MQTETKARFVTDDLVNKSFMLRTITERVIERELQLLSEIREPVLKAATEIRHVASAAAELDLEASFALLAARYNYVRPEVTTATAAAGVHLEIRDGRHPILDRMFTDANPPQSFTPNDLAMTSTSKSILRCNKCSHLTGIIV